MDKIKSDGLYWNSITNDCKYYVKECITCQTKNKSNFLPPPPNNIIFSEQKELYLLDITYIPHEMLNDNKNQLYILSILDHFSKFGLYY